MQENDTKKEAETVKDTSKSALELVNEVKQELSSYRQPFEGPWKEYDDAYYGKQHKTGENVKSVKNHIFKIIEGEIPVLTDSMPGTQVTAASEEMQGAADILEKSIKWVYHDQNLQLKLATLMRSALTSAPGYLYVYYDADADQGDGKICYKQVPWKSVYLDGNAQTIEDSEKFRFELPMRRDALARTWPEKKDELLKANGGKANSFGDSNGFETKDVASENKELGKPKAHTAKDIVTYAETWVKSYDLEDIPAEETQEDLATEQEQLRTGEAPNIKKWENHNEHEAAHKQLRGELLQVVGLPPEASFEEAQQIVEQLLQNNPEAAEQFKEGLLALKVIDNHLEEHEELKKLNPSGQRPKYKDGWRVIKSVEKIVLYDGPNPEENGQIPLVPFYCYKDDTIYGFGEVKNILNAQRTLNDVDFREFENLKNVSNSGWVADFEAEIPEGTLTNAPGLVVTKKRGTEVRRLEPGTVSPQLEQRKQSDAMAMDSLAGQNEQTMNGEMPVGNASGVAVRKSQLQAVGRIRLKDRQLQHYSMKRLALITGSLILNHWTQEKVLRLRGDGFNIEQFYFNPIEMQDLEYIVEMSPGSMAGIDKDQLNAFYLSMMQMQAITPLMFLTVAEIPKKEMLIEMLKEQDQQAQQMQEMQAQIQQAQQQYETQIAELQTQNIKLKGALDLGRSANVELLSGEEKKVFEQQNKLSAIDNLVSQEELQGNPAVTMEPMMANQNNQGI